MTSFVVLLYLYSIELLQNNCYRTPACCWLSFHFPCIIEESVFRQCFELEFLTAFLKSSTNHSEGLCNKQGKSKTCWFAFQDLNIKTAGVH